MADSDDDLYDDIDFDASDLAVIDAEETRYVSATQLPPSRPAPPAKLPPPKRLKTPQGWVPTGGVKREASLNDYDDLPDISVQGDGRYGMQTRPIAGSRRVQATAGAKAPAQCPPPVVTRAPAPVQLARPPAQQQRPVTRVNSGTSNTILQNGHNPVSTQGQARLSSGPPPAAAQPSRTSAQPLRPLARVSSGQVSSSLRNGTVPPSTQQPGTHRSGRPPPGRTLSQIRLALGEPDPDATPAAPTSPAPVLATALDYPTVDRMQADINALRRQLEQLGRSNEEAQKALKEAQNARFAKEGEVSMLRRGMDKTAAEHSASLAKLKAAKEAAEVSQAQMQREMRDEMERLRTQYTFKRHELDVQASTRKAPGTARANRRPMEPPPTPVPMPSQMRGWNAKPTPLGARTPRRSGSLTSTPSRSRTRTSPKKPRAGHSLLPSARGEPRGADGALPGFVNAFAPSTPRRDKGKGRASSTTHGLETPSSARPWPPPLPPELGSAMRNMNGRKSPQPSPPSSPTRHEMGSERRGGMELDQRPLPSLDAALGVDVGYSGSTPPIAIDGGMVDEDGAGGADLDDMSDGERRMFEVFDEIEPIAWKDELQNFVFSHATPWANEMTLQLLMGAALPAETPAAHKTAYGSACASILRTFGVLSRDDAWDGVVAALSRAFIDMITVLAQCAVYSPLTALLELLTGLCFTLPGFSSGVLNAVGPDDGDRDIVRQVAGILAEEMTAPAEDTQENAETRRRLIESALGMLEAVNWRIAETLEARFVPFLEHETLLRDLLRPNQPSWIVYRTCRLLSSLATRSSLFKSILPSTDSDPSEETGAPKAQLLRVESVCGCLSDPSRVDSEAEVMREAILTLLSVLVGAHADAPSILQESETLFPVLAVWLYRLSARVFEDEPALLADSGLTAKTLRTANEALFLLHQLAIGFAPPQGSRHLLATRIQNVPRMRTLLGAHHMFIVGMGRLGYADPPEWVTKDAKGDWRGMQELAQDILECVVQGPEADGVWAAYQGEWEDEETQEPTMERGMLGEDDEVLSAELFD